MAEQAERPKRQPVFKEVKDLRPGTKGHNLHVQVVESKVVLDRAKGPRSAPLKVAECLVGDASGVIVFTARNEQVDLVTKGAYLTIRNARIDMFRGSMRLVVDMWGKVEEGDVTDFKPKVDNNLSLVEYELVTVDPQAAPVAAS